MFFGFCIIFKVSCCWFRILDLEKNLNRIKNEYANLNLNSA